MKWVTRDHVHMDRVASPWLIRRFVDPAAEFIFVPFGSDGPLPPDAIPFGLPGVELSYHDANGSTFRKILVKYEIGSPALFMLAEIIESGIAHVMGQIAGHGPSAAPKFAEGIGLDAVSQGMMLIADGDVDDIDKSMVVYDALHAFCKARLIEAAHPDIKATAYPKRWDLIKTELETALR